MTLFALNLSTITLNVNSPKIDLGGSLLSLDNPIPSGLPAGSMCIGYTSHSFNPPSMEVARPAGGNDNALWIDQLFSFSNMKIGIEIPESASLRRGAGSVDRDPRFKVQDESIQITNLEFMSAIFGKNVPPNCGVAVCSKQADPGVGGWVAEKLVPTAAEQQLPPTANNYFIASTFSLNAHGRIEAKKGNS